MLFSSFEFFIFFTVYLLLHLTVPPAWRLLLIVVGSTVFYAWWNPGYVWIPYFLLFIAYLGARWVESGRGTSHHSLRLAAVVGILLAPLVAFKYANFIYRDVLGTVFGFEGSATHWPLPLGISFITFTVIAYVVDVFRGHYRLEGNPVPVAGLVLFFPHLIAGPILRPRGLLPQLKRPRPARRWLEIRIFFALAIFSAGLLKKMVFADTLATPVQAAFDTSGEGLSSADYLLAWYGFPLQIYCDFSGYTDMAIAIAIALGIRLPQNFKRPYAATSIVEFWRRWHITLSTWLRDYLYVPLGGNRGGAWRRFRNVMITMGLGGLWHGAGGTFLVWGLWHGLGVCVTHLARGSILGKSLGTLPALSKILMTFHFVGAGWILFRAPDLATAWRVMTGPFVAPLGNVTAFATAHLFELMLVAIFFAVHRWDTHRTIRSVARRMPALAYWLILALTWVLCVTISGGESAKFLYFDF